MTTKARVFLSILGMKVVTDKGYPNSQSEEKENDSMYYWDPFSSPHGNSHSARYLNEVSGLLIAESNGDNSNEYDSYS